MRQIFFNSLAYRYLILFPQNYQVCTLWTTVHLSTGTYTYYALKAHYYNLAPSALFEIEIIIK